MKRYVIIFLILTFSCNNSNHRLYVQDIAPISKKTMVIELLSDNGKGRIAIAPKIQGKILTTTYNGLKGDSNGWLNPSAFEGETLDIANIGGENRLWFGPLGGQHSFYYEQKKPLHEDNWLVPPGLSSEPYKLVNFIDKEVLMSKEMKLENFIGTEFSFKVFRKIKLLEKTDIENNLDLSFDESLDYVAYDTSHTIQNTGEETWKKETGLVSIWSAGMFQGSDESVVIIPLGKTPNLDSVYKYMGPLDSDRLTLKDSVLLFKVDGKYRSKIGIPSALAPSIYGSYSKEKQRLTIVQYRKVNESMYSNSHVTIQDNPYEGEVIPIYNNGNMDFSQTDTASFFELESTSASVETPPHRHVGHYHRVYHFSGDESMLNEISEKLLGIDLKDCDMNKTI